MMEKLSLLGVFGLLAIASYATAQNEIVTCPGENQEYSYCASYCPPYCNENSDRACILACREGCQCKPGYIGEAVDSGKCITLEECKKMPKCGANKEYHVCGSMCPKYCGQPNDVVCPDLCVPGCQCKRGYVKRNSSSNSCIRATECPQ